jgi:BON domain
MTLRRRVTTIVVSGVAGAGIAYFMDPNLGRGRRTRTRDQIAAGFRRTGRRFGRTARRAGSDTYGAWQKVRHASPEDRYPDDATLAHKVESELFAGRDVPKGDMNVNVENGVVVLRGQLERRELIEELEAAARKIAGVRDVENLLHLPGEPAPNKAEAYEAGRPATGR